MEAYKNGSKGIDWQNLMLQTGISQDYKLGYFSGTAKNKHLFPANVIEYDSHDHHDQVSTCTVTDKFDNELTKWLTLLTKINASRTYSHNGVLTFHELLNYSSYDGNERSGNGRFITWTPL